MSGVRSPVGRYHSESELQIEWIARVARVALLTRNSGVDAGLDDIAHDLAGFSLEAP